MSLEQAWMRAGEVYLEARRRRTRQRDREAIEFFCLYPNESELMSCELQKQALIDASTALEGAVDERAMAEQNKVEADAAAESAANLLVQAQANVTSTAAAQQQANADWIECLTGS